MSIEDERPGAEGRGETGDVHSAEERPADRPEEHWWVPHVVEIQLRRGLRLQVGRAANGAVCEFKSADESARLNDLNAFLVRHDCRGAEPVFKVEEEEERVAEARAAERFVEPPNLSGFYTLYFPHDVDVHRTADELQELPEVVHAAPVPQTSGACLTSAALPQDPLLGTDDLARDRQWYIFRCGIHNVWSKPCLRFTGRGVVIADIDLGFLTTHPDLAPNLNLEQAYNSSDNSQNVSQGCDLSHGTAVMGLIGAAADGSGVVGVAHNAELWPIQVNKKPGCILDPGTWGRAVHHVTQTTSGGRPKVILVEGETCRGRNITQIASLREAIRNAILFDAVVCVPAGNGGKHVNIDDGNNEFEPVGIIVGATLFNGSPFADSNFGREVVVCAPGDPDYDVTCSDDPKMPYRHGFGATSGAAAKIAGAVALMLEANPNMRHEDVHRILSRTGTPVTSLQIGNFLDCEAAVREALALLS